MAICLSSTSSQRDAKVIFLKSEFLPVKPPHAPINGKYNHLDNGKKFRHLSISAVALPPPKMVRDRSLDKHVVKHNKIRFVQKLKTLLLSKPKHYMPLHVLSKCRSYLCLTKPRTSLLSMIRRYPSIFELFTIPLPATPLNAAKLNSQLCVRLTPAAAALVRREYDLRSTMSMSLVVKLQKLLMLSSHHRLLLSKLVHLASDLGLPPNFRSNLCNNHQDKFKTVDTSYGRALELVSWDPDLANPLPPAPLDVRSALIVDRPLKFKYLRLRKGMNVKRSHREYLIKFEELPGVCPYKIPAGELTEGSIEAEKRACSVVREVLGMTVEKRTLVDHLTHFRKDFGLPNKLRRMLVRHPELFYVSLKGQRDSVFLAEGYDDKGALIHRDEILSIKDQLMELVREGKRMRRERRKGGSINIAVGSDVDKQYEDVQGDGDFLEDGLDNLFESQDLEEDNYSWDVDDYDDDENGDSDGKDYSAVHDRHGYWTADVAHNMNEGESIRGLQPW